MNEKVVPNFCACIGPQGSDPYCPCKMSQKGLKSDYIKWTVEDKQRLQDALVKLKKRAENKK